MFSTTYNKIIVDPIITEKEKIVNGIIVVSNIPDDISRGIVVKTGVGSYQNGVLIPTCVKEGDEIMYITHSGRPITIEGNKYLVMSDAEVIVVLSPSEEK